MALTPMPQLHNYDSLMMLAMHKGIDMPTQPGFADVKHVGSSRRQVSRFVTAVNAGSTLGHKLIVTVCTRAAMQVQTPSPIPAYMVARLNMASGSPNSDPLTNASLAAA